MAVADWAAAERAFVAALAQGVESTDHGALSVIGVAQTRLFGAMDARGAFAVLQSLFTQPTSLSPEVALRLHTVAAHLFATPESGIHDSKRSRAHAEEARTVLTRGGDGEQRALLAVAESWAALDVARDESLIVGSAELRELVGAVGPMTRCLVLEALSFGALAEGDDTAETAWLEEARVAACQIAFAACEARLVMRQALRCARRGERGAARLLRESAGLALTRAAAERSWLSRALQEREVERVDGCMTWLKVAFGVCPRFPSPNPGVAELNTVAAPPNSDLERQIAALAPSRVTVLLVGDSKCKLAELARALHDRSGRETGPFVCVDCATSDVHSLERELFGSQAHGAFDGGAVHQAETGTLHVAQVERLPLLVQARFLRFLDEATGVRVVASTQEDLSLCIKNGLLRSDLGERLLLVRLVLPSDSESV